MSDAAKDNDTLVQLYARLLEKHEKLEKEHEYCALLSEQWRQQKDEITRLQGRVADVSAYNKNVSAAEETQRSRIDDLETKLSAAYCKIHKLEVEAKQTPSIQSYKAKVMGVRRITDSKIGIDLSLEVNKI